MEAIYRTDNERSTDTCKLRLNTVTEGPFDRFQFQSPSPQWRTFLMIHQREVSWSLGFPRFQYDCSWNMNCDKVTHGAISFFPQKDLSSNRIRFDAGSPVDYSAHDAVFRPYL